MHAICKSVSPVMGAAVKAERQKALGISHGDTTLSYSTDEADTTFVCWFRSATTRAVAKGKSL